MNISLKIIPLDLIDQFKSGFNKSLEQSFQNLRDSQLSIENFSFYTSVSAVYSSKIEGADIDLDSYIKHKRFGVEYLPEYTQRTDDLYDAYLFAQNNKLTSATLKQAHALLTRHILPKSQQGKFRTGKMLVVTKDGRIEYAAATADKLQSEMKKLYGDIETLLNANMDFEEVFSFASMLHLVLGKIHPFEDGNGRTSRLLEKWFLAEKLGEKAWFIQSEKNYYTQHQTYYNNLRLLGLEYDELNYSAALPFLEMLPQAINYKG